MLFRCCTRLDVCGLLGRGKEWMCTAERVKSTYFRYIVIHHCSVVYDTLRSFVLRLPPPSLPHMYITCRNSYMCAGAGAVPIPNTGDTLQDKHSTILLNYFYLNFQFFTLFSI